MVKYHNTQKTHRCEGLLKQYMSLHYCKPYSNLYQNYQWWLLRAEENFDCWDEWYLQPICFIEHCPFCGIKLNEV